MIMGIDRISGKLALHFLNLLDLHLLFPAPYLFELHENTVYDFIFLL